MSGGGRGVPRKGWTKGVQKGTKQPSVQLGPRKGSRPPRRPPPELLESSSSPGASGPPPASALPPPVPAAGQRPRQLVSSAPPLPNPAALPPPPPAAASLPARGGPPLAPPRSGLMVSAPPSVPGYEKPLPMPAGDPGYESVAGKQEAEGYAEDEGYEGDDQGYGEETQQMEEEEASFGGAATYADADEGEEAAGVGYDVDGGDGGAEEEEGGEEEADVGGDLYAEASTAVGAEDITTAEVATIMRDDGDLQSAVLTTPADDAESAWAIVTYAYAPEEGQESSLALMEGERVLVSDWSNPEWWWGCVEREGSSVEGYFPPEFVEWEAAAEVAGGEEEEGMASVGVVDGAEGSVGEQHSIEDTRSPIPAAASIKKLGESMTADGLMSALRATSGQRELAQSTSGERKKTSKWREERDSLKATIAAQEEQKLALRAELDELEAQRRLLSDSSFVPRDLWLDLLHLRYCLVGELPALELLAESDEAVTQKMIQLEELVDKELKDPVLEATRSGMADAFSKAKQRFNKEREGLVPLSMSRDQVLPLLLRFEADIQELVDDV